MTRIEITSFQGGLSNDKNVGQEGAFWNSKNIEFRRNSAYIELNKRVTTSFSLTQIPRAITLWGNGGTIASDIVVFTGNGVYTNSGQQSTVTDIINVGEANNKKYFLTTNKIYEYTSPSTNTLRDTFATTTNYRPTLNFYGDLIIGDGNKVARWTEAGAKIEYPTALTVGGLDGTIYALTQVGNNIYIWCNNRSNTNLYIWDGSSSNPSQAIRYTDKPVMNVALLGNMHYWWSAKSDYSIREILVGESYQPQAYIKSDYPKFPISTQSDDEKNRMTLYTSNSNYLNAIETIGDIVYLPGYGRIFGFGRYFPGSKFALNTEFGFTGSSVTSMTAGGTTGSGRDAGGMLVFSAQNGSNYDINIVNLGQEGETQGVTFSTSGFIETMEYIAPSFAEGEQNRKILVPYEIPTADTSIKVSVKTDRGSYTEIKTISSADGLGYHVAEVPFSGKWRTIQFKFELITTDVSVTPKLYANITNLSETCGNKS